MESEEGTWVAEQKHPIRRRVALKIIKLGLDTKQVIGRFEAERQALAVIDQPSMQSHLLVKAVPTEIKAHLKTRKKTW